MKLWKMPLLALCFSFPFENSNAASEVAARGRAEVLDVVDLVNPMIGTTGTHPTEYGGRIPTVMVPFGMTQWAPMTRENAIGRCPYHYKDASIIGFTGTHQPAIWMGDYGFMSFMPQSGQLKFSVNERAQYFSHSEEEAHPDFYAVKYGEVGHQLTTEHTATTRCGFFKITYPEDGAAYMTVEMSRMSGFEGYVKIIPEKRQVIGYNPDRQNHIGGRDMGPDIPTFKGYYVLQFDTDFEEYGTYMNAKGGRPAEKDIFKHAGATTEKGDYVGAYLRFKTKKSNEVKVKIGSSYISLEQAQENLDREIAGWNFDKTRQGCREEWEKRLGTIQVEGGSKDQQAVLYSCLYYTMMYPSLFSEYGKYYSPFDGKIHDGVSYNAYSLWDTFRAEHPLLVLLARDQVAPMVTGLLQMYKEGGWMPKWPNPSYSNIMIGTHADAVVADAYVKGVRGFDLETAYKAVYKDAMVAPDGDRHNQWEDRGAWTAYEGRGGLSWYKELGYVPCDKTKESVSRTLEFAYGDYCVAQMAKAVGKMDDYKYFMQRSKNYKNLYNKESGFMHARLSNGKFAEKVYQNSAFTEGSPWTYLFCAMQDVPGLVETLGGKDAFVKKLDENFSGRHYRHTNEPGHHYIYLYDYVNEGGKAQRLIDETRRIHYYNRPDGLTGNDDCGQMSAWYVFSAMGFYPVCPGSDEYAIGTPLFKKMTVDLGDGHTLTIKANNLSRKNIYVKQVRIDGKVHPSLFLKHSDLMNHKLLEFDMQSTPAR